MVGASKVGLYGNIGAAVGGFLYSQGTMTDLNIPGAMAIGINDSGWIVANNLTLNHAYLLRPSSVSLTPIHPAAAGGRLGGCPSRGWLSRWQRGAPRGVPIDIEPLTGCRNCF